MSVTQLSHLVEKIKYVLTFMAIFVAFAMMDLKKKSLEDALILMNAVT